MRVPVDVTTATCPNRRDGVLRVGTGAAVTWQSADGPQPAVILSVGVPGAHGNEHVARVVIGNRNARELAAALNALAAPDPDEVKRQIGALCRAIDDRHIDFTNDDLLKVATLAYELGARVR